MIEAEKVLLDKKAELDWCERHPEVKNRKRFKRIAGEIATFGGEPIKTGEIQRTWKQKGWVVDDIDKVYHAAITRALFNESKLAAEEKTREQKWKIVYGLVECEGLTVGEAAKRMGTSFLSLQAFIKAWQDQLGSRLGHINIRQSGMKVA